MAHIIADRVRDTSTTEGSGPTGWTVTGTPPLRYQTFSDVVTVNGDTFPYCIVHQTADEWEVGLATRTAANVFTRTTVFASSTGGSAVAFTAGTKDTILVFPANPAMANSLEIGNPTDTTLSRQSAGVLQVETNAILMASNVATTDEYIANTSDKILATDEVNASGAFQALTVGGSTVPWNMTADGWNVSFTLTATPRTLENPSNPIVGRTGMIVVTQDSTGTRILNYGTQWDAAGGTLPVLSTAANSVDMIFYIVRTTTSFVITGILKAIS